MDPITSRALGAYNDALRRGAGAGTGGIAGGGASPAAAGGPDASFSAVLGRAMDDAVATSVKADQVSLSAAAGKANVTDVVTALTNAEVTLQAVVAVRDKVVSAYQEIMRMPI
ncbi:flagellar hook-basal body complex protein FliE [Zavarzinia compransoris]|uniref:Flagellar hook-basal body complex protein FliE n=1 Tax=Zavarzinia compransoris TaxID=1264899 RepID=A0A317DZG3_9PROT|nr:flagellar hook-basal body complex protein FliE [Zavarzinia compransoris]PWR19811.1 flagellar hook-basal body complex protein FliE [Zavarzinia compransoris]TDP45084.1 flagellar hook-basal body complex protein FliE [Zavarzinia compransoris]